MQPLRKPSAQRLADRLGDEAAQSLAFPPQLVKFPFGKRTGSAGVRRGAFEKQQLPVGLRCQYLAGLLTEVWMNG